MSEAHMCLYRALATLLGRAVRSSAQEEEMKSEDAKSLTGADAAEVL